MKPTGGFSNRDFLYGSTPAFIITLVFLLISIVFVNAGLADQNKTKVDSNTVETVRKQGKEVNMGGADRLTDEQGKYLLSVARKTIEDSLSGRKNEEKSNENFPPIFNEERGTFVTLTMGGHLRGCIGHIIAQESLIEGIRVNAINAAFRDPRFDPVGKKDWDRIKMEISILTDPKPLAYSDADDLLKKLRSGIDGVILKKGYRQSTFLPQVWEQLPEKEEFLNHLCQKAGLDGNAWRKGDLEVSTYQVQAFEEE